MSEKTSAVLNIGKALLVIPFTALAAIGCAVAGLTGDYSLAILWAGLSALPVASLTAYDPVKTQVEKLISSMSSKSQQLEVPVPHWWTGDTRSWQNVCTEIENHLPAILERITQLMHQDQRVKTAEVVQKIFIDAIAAQHLNRVYNHEEQRRIAAVLALPVWQKISQVLSPVISQVLQEEAFKDIRTTALSTKEAANLLREILDTFNPPVLREEEIAILRQQYCDALYEYWQMLDFRGIMHVEINRPMSLPLTQVFVRPDVLVGVPEYETVERDEENKGEGSKGRRYERPWEEEQEWITDQDQRLKKEKQIVLQREDLPAVLGKSRRLVILGDPGAGKSTLLRYLLLLLTHELEEFIQDFPQLDDAVSMIPLYVRLAEYAEVWKFKAPGERSLADFLPKYLQQNHPQVSITFVQRQLEQGLAFLLLDGLDEIPDASLRHEVVEQIRAFTHAYPKNRFIVTSRIVGYKEAPLPADYQPYTLAPFNEKQIKQFAQKWCPAYELWVKGERNQQHLKNAGTKEAEELFRATQDNPGVKRLAVNPLLLTILALIQRQGVELPNHRIKLFDLCVTTLIDTWIKVKKQHLDFDDFEMFETLRSLAFWMHERSAIGVIKEEDLVEQVVRQLGLQGVKEYEARKIARQFLLTVRGKAGILIERGEQRYGFLHQTFEEYFAARELEVCERLNNGEKRDDFIRRNLHNPRWREVILLAVGTIGILQKNRSKATELVQDVILKVDSPFEDSLHRDLLFAGFCLADDIRLNPSCEDEIIEQIVYLYLTSPYNSLQQACFGVLRAWSGTRAGRKATQLVVPLIGQLEAFADGNKPGAVSPFEEKFIKYYQELIRDYQEEWIKLVRLQVMMVLSQLQDQSDLCQNG